MSMRGLELRGRCSCRVMSNVGCIFVCAQTLSSRLEFVEHFSIWCREVKENLALLDELEQAARAVKGSERSWQRAGHEYTLWLDGEEVMTLKASISNPRWNNKA
mgnify:CR=1 FL=1